MPQFFVNTLVPKAFKKNKVLATFEGFVARMIGEGSKAVWNFSENSSVLVLRPLGNPSFKYDQNLLNMIRIL